MRIYAEIEGNDKENIRNLLLKIADVDATYRTIEFSDSIIEVNIYSNDQFDGSSVVKAITKFKVNTLVLEECSSKEYAEKAKWLQRKTNATLKTFCVEDFPELKDIVDNATCSADLVEEVSEFFNLGIRREIFKKMLKVFMTTPQSSWDWVKDELEKEISQWEKRDCNARVRKFLRDDFGYKPESTITVIRIIIEYYNSMLDKLSVKCMTDIPAFLDILISIDKNLGKYDKMKRIFRAMEKADGLNFSDIEINDVTKFMECTGDDLSEELDKLDASTYVTLSGVLDRYRASYLKGKIPLEQFLKELKKAIF